GAVSRGEREVGGGEVGAGGGPIGERTGDVAGRRERGTGLTGRAAPEFRAERGPPPTPASRPTSAPPWRIPSPRSPVPGRRANARLSTGPETSRRVPGGRGSTRHEKRAPSVRG